MAEENGLSYLCYVTKYPPFCFDSFVWSTHGLEDLGIKLADMKKITRLKPQSSQIAREYDEWNRRDNIYAQRVLWFFGCVYVLLLPTSTI